MVALNPEQERAASCGHRRIGVVAGAGTGKTAVLTERVRRIVAAGADPRRILVCTFTEKAAGELLERLEDVEPAPLVGTLHAFCAQVIRELGDAVDFTREFAIYDETDRQDVLADAGLDLGLPPKDQRVRDLFADRLRQANALTYDQLEHYALRCLELRVPDRFRFDHVLVDEAQDLSPAQSRLIKLLNPVNLFMVGDPRQAIYGFRGARPELFRGYIDHEAVERIDLTTNYRSGPEIVHAANHVMGDWPALEAGVDVEDRVRLVEANDEGERIALELQDLISDGIAPGEIAVLGRTWNSLRHIARSLREAEIGYTFYGRNNDPWEQPDGRVFARWLLLHEHRFDDNIAALVCRHVAPDLPLGDLRAAAGQARRSLWQHLALEEHLPGPVDTDSPIELAQALGVEIPPRIERDLGRWRTLRHFRYWWHFGRQVADRLSADPHRVHLLTVHGSKGLEFEAVVLPWCNAGTYPYRFDEYEEDRRVFYVGTTRARRVLTFTRQRVVRGQHKSLTPYLSSWRRDGQGRDPDMVAPSAGALR